MGRNDSDRRQFLRQGAIGLAGGAAGLTAGAGLPARGEAKPDGAAVREIPSDSGAQIQSHVHGELPRRGVKYSIDHMTHYAPLQDYPGIITPAPVHYMQQHASELPDIDASQHRLTIHGMVDRPLSFSMEDLKRFPSISRIHFLECQGNSDPAFHAPQNPNYGMPIQYLHGMTSNSEWSGVLYSVLLNEAGLQKGASWLVLEGADAGKFSHTLPLAKALDDSFVAYAQNGEPLRREQGFPIRSLVPGWEGPFSVKYLRHIKVVDQPYNTWNESINHAVVDRPDLGGKARWYHFQMPLKSVITRPSAAMQMPRGYVQITGLAWSGAGKVTKVEVSTDGGKNWAEATLQGPIHTKAHTRFTFDWQWDGEEANLQSRCTDETGEVQPSLAELNEHWQLPMEAWFKSETRPRARHMNAIQPWKVARDGSITDGMFT